MEDNSYYTNELQSHTEGPRTMKKKMLSYEMVSASPEFKEKKQDGPTYKRDWNKTLGLRRIWSNPLCQLGPCLLCNSHLENITLHIIELVSVSGDSRATVTTQHMAVI